MSTLHLREQDPTNNDSLGDAAGGGGEGGAAAGGSSNNNGNGENNGDGDDKSARRAFNVIDNQLQKPTVPDVYPQVLAVPIARRPLFPGFYKAVVIKDPNVTGAIKDLLKRGQPYVGAFLLKDENVDVDTITNLDQVHKVGVFAQITSVFPANSKNKEEGDGGLTAVLYPHRRIQITDLINTTGKPVEAAVEEVKAEEQELAVKEAETVAKEAEAVTEQSNTAAETEKEPQYATSFLANEHAVSLVNVENMIDPPYDKKDPMIRAVTSEIVSVFKEIASLNPLFRDQIASFSMSQSAGNVFEEPAKLADFAAAVSTGEPLELQEVMETLPVEDRLQKALIVLKKELMNAQLQNKISKDVESKIAKRQREYYLMEQLKGIKKELGLESDGKDKLVEGFKEKAGKLVMPEGVRKVFDEEVNKLAHLEPAASEFNVTRNYLDWLTQVPWGQRSRENYNVSHAKTVLDEDHYGLQDVKERILEFIAVGKLRGTVEGKILCLSGPPGVGKTSIGKSIARALDREFYRFSVGGLTDVAEIKGHRRTYVGAMPGKVIQALKKVKTENPLILIDEIDKIGRGHQGDPSSALLELLDPEQNSSFLDHYMDVPVDLSKVLFVCTANVLDTIPGPLLDRMEVIQLSGYVAEEKAAIASKYLAPSARIASGLENVNVNLSPEAVDALIRNYCRESGVRNLKKHIDKVFRKAGYQVVEKVAALQIDEDVKVEEKKEPVTENAAAGAESTSVDKTEHKEEHKPLSVPEDIKVDITADNLKDYVGPPVFQSDRIYETTPPGVIMGLAWTSMGGSSLYIESVLESSLTPKSTPNLSKTGQLGDVMKESTSIAYTYAKSLMATRFPKNKFFEKARLHLHCPAGAVPKDGPSAGVTMVTSLVSLALNKSVSPNIAMTGELTVTGRVLKIGGLKEKTIAAKRSKIDTILFPKDNLSDWEELADHIKEGMTGIPVEYYEDVFKVCFPDVSKDKAENVWAHVLKPENEETSTTSSSS
ncbi:Lon protease C-terminal proteolytic domain-containing protein [Zychaea mexicana]|uniref:Lon protease C-terminal proteolytic domain-containing protein n=1 Tax=Zychaea mexicana TaxID=64656 RepID=UPI0022FE5730|nr:Lon protease C-terminal proteolytic domain-containing protein [Zychaea mexicana]KAI9498574.1 Lon protease C-terminal proteolytic domain-containing protein [Zychaea mexicana]